MTSARDRRFVTVAGTQVHLRLAGQGPAVLLMHEAPLSSASLTDAMSELSSSFSVLAPDLPGCGLSEPLVHGEPGTWTRRCAALLLELMDGLGVEQFAVVVEGISAAVALELIRSRPGRVTAAVIARSLPLTAQEGLELREHGYHPPIVVRGDGTHLYSAWASRRLHGMYFPWFRQTSSSRLHWDLPSPGQLHSETMDVLCAAPDNLLVADLLLDADLLALAAEACAATPTTVVRRRDGVTEELVARLGRGATVIDVDSRAAELTAYVDALAGHRSGPAWSHHDPVPVISRPGQVDHRYVDSSYGRLLVRTLGGEHHTTPLVMLHGSPAAGGELLPLARKLARHRTVHVIDTLGNGDSDRPPFREPWAGDYAEVMAGALDALGLDEFDLYGSHTGGVIATETAIRLPHRARRLIVEGVLLHEPEFIDEVLERYFPPFEIRADGTQFLWAWHIVASQSQYFPWYDTSAAAIRPLEPAGAQQLHEHTLMFLRTGATYPLSYRAAFKYRARERLSRLTTPTLVCAEPGDMLLEYTDEAVRLIGAHASGAVLPASPAERAAMFGRFLEGGEKIHADQRSA